MLLSVYINWILFFSIWFSTVSRPRDYDSLLSRLSACGFAQFSHGCYCCDNSYFGNSRIPKWKVKRMTKTFFALLFWYLLLNPLTQVPPITARDTPCPLFHFWRRHLWLKLASSILNFCRMKRSFQWFPGQSDWLSGGFFNPSLQWSLKYAWKCSENWWKTQSKIACIYTCWLLHGKNCPFRWFVLRIFLTGSKSSRMLITAAKT